MFSLLANYYCSLRSAIKVQLSKIIIISINLFSKIRFCYQVFFHETLFMSDYSDLRRFWDILQ
jgi:hypothetical protein